MAHTTIIWGPRTEQEGQADQQQDGSTKYTSWRPMDQNKTLCFKSDSISAGMKSETKHRKDNN